MTGPEVNMQRAEMLAKVTLGEGDRMLDDATVDGRAVTEDERAELGAAVLVDLQAAILAGFAIERQPA